MSLGHLVMDKKLYDYAHPELLRQFQGFIDQGKLVEHKESSMHKRYDWYLDHPDFHGEEDDVYILSFINKRDSWGNSSPKLGSLKMLDENGKQKIIKVYT